MKVLEATKLVREILRNQGFGQVFTNKLKNSRTVKTYVSLTCNPIPLIEQALNEHNVKFKIRRTKGKPSYRLPALIIEIDNIQI